MRVNPILTAILHGHFLMEESAVQSYLPMVAQLLTGQFKAADWQVEVEGGPEAAFYAFTPHAAALGISPYTKLDDIPAGSVAVHQVRGVMMEEDSCFSIGTRTIGRGEVIRAGDLTVERRPRSETVALSGDSIVSLTQAVGLAARRPLQSERGFRLSDLMKPELVERNGNVLIILDMPGLSLSVRGKALEAGAEGEVIQVQNLQSRKTLQAVVTGPGRVAVRLNGSSIVAAGPTP